MSDTLISKPQPLGKMAAMPRRTRPQPALAPDLEIAARAFTSREDLAILAFLARVESAMAPEICGELHMALNTVHRHLGMLESLGLVLVDTPAGARRGRAVRYALDRAATAATADKMKAALLGGRGGG